MLFIDTVFLHTDLTWFLRSCPHPHRPHPTNYFPIDHTHTDHTHTDHTLTHVMLFEYRPRPHT